jgi:hypothetical protein
MSSQDFGEPGEGQAGESDTSQPAGQPDPFGQPAQSFQSAAPDSWSQAWQEGEQTEAGPSGLPPASPAPGAFRQPVPPGQPGPPNSSVPLSPSGAVGQPVPPVPPVPFAQPAASFQAGQPAAGQFGGYSQPAATAPSTFGQVGGYHQPGGYQPGNPQWGQAPVQLPRNNRKAIAALVCGIGQFVLGLLLVGNILLAIPAIILGAMGMRETAERGDRGRGMAIAGLVLGILGVVYFLLVILLIIVGIHLHKTT